MVIEKFNKLSHLLKRLKLLENQNKWIFRGQEFAKWNLQTSFERMLIEANIPFKDAYKYEIGLLKKFQRESHYYSIPKYDFLNIPEWLSVMQHYGVPTRLLDWTHSPWVGLFFSVINKKDKSNSAIFALNWNKLDIKTHPNIKKLFNIDNNLINIDSFISAIKCGPGIIKLNSYKQNERQIIQQGTFLLPLSINQSFISNIRSTLKDRNDIIKIIISNKLVNDLIKMLFRMNITYATLYPGITGYSMSLKKLYLIEGLLSVEDNINKFGFEGFKNKMQLTIGSTLTGPRRSGS